MLPVLMASAGNHCFAPLQHGEQSSPQAWVHAWEQRGGKEPQSSGRASTPWGRGSSRCLLAALCSTLAEGGGRQGLHPTEQDTAGRFPPLPPLGTSQPLSYPPVCSHSSPFLPGESVVEGAGRELLPVPCLLPQDPPLHREKTSRGSAVQAEMDVCSWVWPNLLLAGGTGLARRGIGARIVSSGSSQVKSSIAAKPGPRGSWASTISHLQHRWPRAVWPHLCSFGVSALVFPLGSPSHSHPSVHQPLCLHSRWVPWHSLPLPISLPCCGDALLPLDHPWHW